MRHNNRKSYPGFTLMELVIAMLISSILVLVAGVLIVSGTKAWQQTYNKAHTQAEEDTLAVTMAFGSIGRMSNRTDYVIYKVTGSAFTPAVSPTPSQETVVWGNAVEFRYWDVSLDAGDTHNLMNFKKDTATAYALFYLDGSQLKVDYGSIPPGAVPVGGGARNTSHVSTTVLASNVSTDPNGAFSHTSLNNIGEGCVRINIILTDPNDGEQTRMMTSVLMRNIWPR